MVAPISGPFTKTITVKGPPTSLGYKPDWLAITRVWRRQRKPYNLPLVYSLDSRRVVSHYDSDGTVYAATNNVWYGVPQYFVDNAYNKAYAKFVNKLHDSAEMLVNLAEHRQANQMITTRVVQLARFARAIRRFRFGEAAAALGMSRQSIQRMNLRSTSKALGNNWLEFHFGWSPLIGDIKTAMDILTSGLPPFRIKVKAAMDLPESSSSLSLSHGTTSSTRYHEGFLIAAGISVENPNLWLANRLGLVNPLGLAWELVPFSFVLDWFVNLNDVLKSSSEFYGLNLINPYRTEFRTVDHSETEYWRTFWMGSWITTRSRRMTTNYCAVGRSLGIPGPTLRVRPAKALSWQRGLTAVSLLLQSIKG